MPILYYNESIGVIRIYQLMLRWLTLFFNNESVDESSIRVDKAVDKMCKNKNFYTLLPTALPTLHQQITICFNNNNFINV